MKRRTYNAPAFVVIRLYEGDSSDGIIKRARAVLQRMQGHGCVKGFTDGKPLTPQSAGQDLPEKEYQVVSNRNCWTPKLLAHSWTRFF